MSREVKQQFLRESILEDNLDSETFINFMEQDTKKGADLDKWDLQELKDKVQEFKEKYPPPSKAIQVKPEMPQQAGKIAEKAVKGDDDEDDLDLGGHDKDRKLDADDDLDKDSKYYGRKDCIKL